ncbi:hypothetical protein GCM10025880_02370 [Methylorubrum aminovorans]|nr:hypothetical protein GCM10025880_02370 [Methylorubrum aminovorans]
MAGDEMAAEFVAELERALEIDPRALAPGTDRGAGQGLGGGIDREAAAGPVRLHRDGREAGAGAGDRGAERNSSGIVGALDDDPAQALGALHRDDAADIGDEPGEHVRSSRR